MGKNGQGILVVLVIAAFVLTFVRLLVVIDREISNLRGLAPSARAAPPK